MKLYEKPLRSLEELKREQYVLRYALKNSKEGLSLDKIAARSHPGDPAAIGIISAVVSALGSKSSIGVLFSLMPTLLSGLSKRGRVRSSGRKDIAGSLLKSVIFGFLKWKILMLLLKGVKEGIKSARQKE